MTLIISLITDLYLLFLLRQAYCEHISHLNVNKLKKLIVFVKKIQTCIFTFTCCTGDEFEISHGFTCFQILLLDVE